MGYRVGHGREWTNASVLAFAAGRDPIEAILDRARTLTTDAIDRGWQGPPFDPFELAKLLSMEVEPKGDVRDARITQRGDGTYSIELNPVQPKVRQRFSLAHEIAHSLFPDCAESVQHRHPHSQVSESDWELEALCNIAAAEFLMPLGSMPEERHDGSIDESLEIRARYLVSSEAVIIRTVQLSRDPIAMFSASRIEEGTLGGRYRLDYAIEGSAWLDVELAPGELIERDSPIAQCTAIGYTRKGTSTFAGHELRVECVGVTGYPGRMFPRVVGFLSAPNSKHVEEESVVYLRGDAAAPTGNDVRIVAFMTNDATSNWGGGLAKQVAIRHPGVQNEFRAIVQADQRALTLGSFSLIQAEEKLYFAPIVAQHGYGKSDQPRIRYQALENALKALGPRAAELGASIHMPRLGAGAAGGNWNVIREMIEEYLRVFVPVYVYDLPGRVQAPRNPRMFQDRLRFADAV